MLIDYVKLLIQWTVTSLIKLIEPNQCSLVASQHLKQQHSIQGYVVIINEAITIMAHLVNCRIYFQHHRYLICELLTGSFLQYCLPLASPVLDWFDRLLS